MSHYLYVTPFFPSPDNWRGAYCFDFVKALKRLVEGEGRRAKGEQWRVLVFVPGTGPDYEIDGVKVYRFPTKQLPSNLFPLLFRRYNERSFLSKLRDVMRERCAVRGEGAFSAVRGERGAVAAQVAICHAHTANFAIYAVAAKRAFGCQTLLHHHDLASFGLNLGVLKHCALYNAWLFCRLRKLFEQIDCHVFISAASRKSFLAAPNTDWTIYEDYKRQMRGPRLFHCRPAKIRKSMVLHNGVDTSIFHPSSTPSTPLHGSMFTIGCIGNFIDLKDQESLIRAVGIFGEEGWPCRGGEGVEKIRVLFVGSGPKLEECKRLASAIEQKVNTSTVNLNLQPQPKVVFDFLPEVRHEQLPDFYHSLDLFVLPSYFEGFGCVYTEAWACGVPFIACEGQGVEDLIAPEDREKWLCKPHDPVDLAAKIKYYIEHRPEQRLTAPVGINELVANFVQTTLNSKP